MKKKTLIVFGTRKGTTTETCQLIAQVLKDDFLHDVEVVNIKSYSNIKKRLNEFDNLVIGTSIVSGRWVSKCRRVLKSLRKANKRLIVVVTAGGTMNKVKKYGITKEEAINEGIEKYIQKYTNQYKIDLFDKMVFGGKVRRKGEFRYDNWNEEDITAWTRQFGQKLYYSTNYLY